MSLGKQSAAFLESTVVGYVSQATPVRHNSSLDETIKGGNVQDLTFEKNMVVDIIMKNPTFMSVPSLGKAYNNGEDGSSSNSWKVIMCYLLLYL